MGALSETGHLQRAVRTLALVASGVPWKLLIGSRSLLESTLFGMISWVPQLTPSILLPPGSSLIKPN